VESFINRVFEVFACAVQLVVELIANALIDRHKMKPKESKDCYIVFKLEDGVRNAGFDNDARLAVLSRSNRVN